MKAGEKPKIVRAFAPFLPPYWQRKGNEYMRREGDWVQILVFYTSQWDDKYEPRSCLEFLKDPDDATGSYLVQGLVHTKSKSQRWVTLNDPADSIASVFKVMARQFKPNILKPLKAAEIKRMLKAESDYWVHAYALCVMAAEAGKKAEAERYYAKCDSSIEDKTWDWAVKRLRELRTCVREAGTEKLKERLKAIQVEKLRVMKLAP